MTEDDHKKTLLEFLADHSNIKSVLLCRAEGSGGALFGVASVNLALCSHAADRCVQEDTH